MSLNSIDLLEELKKSRNQEDSILDEVNAILNEERRKEISILNRINTGSGQAEELVEYDRENLYSIDQIKKMCIKYRLRFLDSKYFKGEIPQEAIQKIKKLENRLQISIKSFKIIAPKKLFKLQDKDADPVLFVQLSNGFFYFIHKWGGELNPWRSLLAFPLRNFMTMFWFLAAVSFVFSLSIPTPNTVVFLFLLVHSFIGICGIACLLVFSLRENFSNVEWDSKYFS